MEVYWMARLLQKRLILEGNEREGQAMAELLFAALILGAPFLHCAAALFCLAPMRFAPSAGTSQTDVAGRP